MKKTVAIGTTNGEKKYSWLIIDVVKILIVCRLWLCCFLDCRLPSLRRSLRVPGCTSVSTPQSCRVVSLDTARRTVRYCKDKWIIASKSESLHNQLVSSYSKRDYFTRLLILIMSCFLEFKFHINSSFSHKSYHENLTLKSCTFSHIMHGSSKIRQPAPS